MLACCPGRFRQLVNARGTRVNGKRLGFINDLAVASDGTIYFTSSSSKYTRAQYLDIILEGETSGRWAGLSVYLFECFWLINVTAACQGISAMNPLRQLYLPSR